MAVEEFLTSASSTGLSWVSCMLMTSRPTCCLASNAVARSSLESSWHVPSQMYWILVQLGPAGRFYIRKKMSKTMPLLKWPLWPMPWMLSNRPWLNPTKTQYTWTKIQYIWLGTMPSCQLLSKLDVALLLPQISLFLTGHGLGFTRKQFTSVQGFY